MIKRKVRIATIDNVKIFNKAAEAVDCDVDLVSGKYTIDAKSIMGIFSLDVAKVLEVWINTDDENKAKPFLNAIAKMIVTGS